MNGVHPVMVFWRLPMNGLMVGDAGAETDAGLWVLLQTPHNSLGSVKVLATSIRLTQPLTSSPVSARTRAMSFERFQRYFETSVIHSLLCSLVKTDLYSIIFLT
jgi:hypothetical protein